MKTTSSGCTRTTGCSYLYTGGTSDLRASILISQPRQPLPGVAPFYVVEVKVKDGAAPAAAPAAAAEPEEAYAARVRVVGGEVQLLKSEARGDVAPLVPAGRIER